MNTSAAPTTNGTPGTPQPSAPVTNGLAESQRPTSAESQPVESNGGPSQAKTFPSIHALVNGTADTAEVKSEAGATSRHGSRSPNSQLQHVKDRNPGYGGEDSKALRSLDKAFMVR